jgi:flavin reductase (DIM6/NTAB) family NADH-FMN oxidoreductase RutF
MSERIGVQMANSEVAQVMDYMPYGLYVIGSRMESECNGMMADWVMQVSFQPRMLAVCLENDAQTLANVRAHEFFTVNFLSEGESSMHLAGTFARPYMASKIGGPRVRGIHHKLEEGDYTFSDHGCPILHGVMAWLECKAVNLVPSGDHTLVMAEVMSGQLIKPENPLTSVYIPVGTTAAEPSM